MTKVVRAEALGVRAEWVQPPAMETPVPFEEVTRGLEELRMLLIAMEADAVTEAETAAMESAISSIRLQLKRLRADQDVMHRAVIDADEPLSRGRSDRLARPIH
jgi:hypothetical protein